MSATSGRCLNGDKVTNRYKAYTSLAITLDLFGIIDLAGNFFTKHGASIVRASKTIRFSELDIALRSQTGPRS